jgi:2,4-dienoyl-CoA reductase-like NADH-dependent reductase (Old Yellow Enzyme family)
LSNHRADRYGGDFEGRSRLVLELAQRLRACWSPAKPLFVRLSATDDLDGGWELADSVRLASRLKDLGVDVIDCSSGGIVGSATGAQAIIPRTVRKPLFQVPLARAVKEQAGIATMAVGLILTPQQAAEVADSGAADLVAIGREALADPNWPLHAAQSLGIDADHVQWPKQFGWWLNVREGLLRKLGLR